MMDLPQQRERLEQFMTQGRAPKSPLRATNDVSDIAGARPLLHAYAFTHKPHFYDPHDIKGSTSKQLHPTTRRVGNDDAYKQLPIEGSLPQPHGFRTDRVVNPLNPEYRLPSFTPAPPVIPKFMRDSYNVSDIEGTKSKRREVAVPRDPMKLDDLPGAQPGWQPRHKRALRENPPRDILDARDITDVDFKSSRVTNVLNPVYTVNGITVEDDPLSHPASQHPFRNKPSFALTTSDILGASCSDPAKSVVAGIVNEQRRHFRATNETADINGAHADTLAHSIRSERRVDPVWPRYRALDGAPADASAISVGKSIVFADLIAVQDRAQREKELREDHEQQKKPYIVSGVGNVGLVQSQTRPGRRASTSSTVSSGNTTAKIAVKRASASAGDSRPPGAISGRVPLAERKQAESRREDIELVRQLS